MEVLSFAKRILFDLFLAWIFIRFGKFILTVFAIWMLIVMVGCVTGQAKDSNMIEDKYGKAVAMPASALGFSADVVDNQVQWTATNDTDYVLGDVYVVCTDGDGKQLREDLREIDYVFIQPHSTQSGSMTVNGLSYDSVCAIDQVSRYVK